ncbi:hypothetical protein DRJ17_00690 [Candidatus Woesearchaeota archaeon]|nr:MAG: hypothetical protein DRJ17_00690 [Candidatus Woesearchaeota archaeon]
MKDLQTVEKFQQAQAEKWAKKEKDIHLQVCFKKAVDVEIHLIQGAQALDESEITARILKRAEYYFLGYEKLKSKLIDGISEEADQDEPSR